MPKILEVELPIIKPKQKIASYEGIWWTEQTALITQVYNANPQWYPQTNGHAGLDTAAGIHSEIIAAYSGFVEVSQDDTVGFGRHVRIRSTLHDGTEILTIYGHLFERYVNVGDIIRAGEIIGLQGGNPDEYCCAGNSTGDHLHFEIRDSEVVNEKYGAVDPIPFVLEHSYPEPALDGVVIAPAGLNVRSEPNTDSHIVRTLHYGEQFKGWESREIGGDIWVRICSPREEWIAVEYQGNIYATYIEYEPAPEPPEPPEEIQPPEDIVQPIKIQTHTGLYVGLIRKVIEPERL